MIELNNRGSKLLNQLTGMYIHKQKLIQEQQLQEKVNIVGVGRTVTAAYEQLRNAAENAEEHLLLQNAIRRFYKQLFITRDNSLLKRSGEELALELTLAGYIKNDSLTKKQIKKISEISKKYYDLYQRLIMTQGVQKSAEIWTLNVMAVEVESVLNDHIVNQVFVDLAYEQLLNVIDQNIVFGENKPQDFGPALFVAIYQALLKMDEASIRFALLQRYGIDVKKRDQYLKYNELLDNLFASNTVDVLRRIVDRQGAPLRIMRRMLEEEQNLDQTMQNKKQFLDLFKNYVVREYSHIDKRLKKAIVRSVIFLIITKVIIGVAIEVPYDIWVHGYIIWLPLIINLLFPPLYLMALRATHQLPTRANTELLVERANSMFYKDGEELMRMKNFGQRFKSGYYVVYGLLSLIVVSFVVYLLHILQFEIVHMVIFMIFMSAASFLGFRLSRLIRELEVTKSTQNMATFVRDLLYLPFVVMGRWISDKYSRVNIVAGFLDMLIELPLKTVLRLVRQWTSFIDERKDNM